MFLFFLFLPYCLMSFHLIIIGIILPEQEHATSQPQSYKPPHVTEEKNFNRQA